jgi:hypothetical protein
MLAQLIIPAAAGILGVLVGGLITFYGQEGNADMITFGDN